MCNETFEAFFFDSLTPSASLLNANEYVTVYESPGLISPTIRSSAKTSPSDVIFQIRLVLAVPTNVNFLLFSPFLTYLPIIFQLDVLGENSTRTVYSLFGIISHAPKFVQFSIAISSRIPFAASQFSLNNPDLNGRLYS